MGWLPAALTREARSRGYVLFRVICEGLRPQAFDNRLVTSSPCISAAGSGCRDCSPSALELGRFFLGLREIAVRRRRMLVSFRRILRAACAARAASSNVPDPRSSGFSLRTDSYPAHIAPKPSASRGVEGRFSRRRLAACRAARWRRSPSSSGMRLTATLEGGVRRPSRGVRPGRRCRSCEHSFFVARRTWRLFAALGVPWYAHPVPAHGAGRNRHGSDTPFAVFLRRRLRGFHAVWVFVRRQTVQTWGEILKAVLCQARTSRWSLRLMVAAS